MTEGAEAPGHPRWRRGLVCGVLWAMLWLPIGILVGVGRPWESASPCWLRKEGPVLLSPDGAMAVQMEHRVCEHPFFTVDLVTRLEAWRVAAPETRYTLASWEWAGGNDDRVKVAWTGPRDLRVSLTAWSGASLNWPPLAGLVLTVVQAAPLKDDPAGDSLRERGGAR